MQFLSNGVKTTFKRDAAGGRIFAFLYEIKEPNPVTGIMQPIMYCQDGQGNVTQETSMFGMDDLSFPTMTDRNLAVNQPVYQKLVEDYGNVTFRARVT